MTLRECCDNAVKRLTTRYSPNEARWMVRDIFHHLKGYELADILLKADDQVSDYISGKVDSIVGRVTDGEPIQYVLGDARFFGMTFKVTPDTLIPRPETEEMTDLIVNRWGRISDLKVLDLCTGSGCIAIALARNLPFSTVVAVDLSEKALQVARDNARTLRANVEFIREDVLKMVPDKDVHYDIITANPPYVLESEKAAMDSNVLDHEPHMALFVPDNDPLRFYRPIISYAAEALRKDGMAYLEINPLEADALVAYASKGPWSDVSTALDISKRKRFLILTR